MGLHQQANGAARLTGIGFVAALGLWAAGVTLPVLTVTQLFVFEDAFSLVGAAATLFDEGEWVVGLVVVLFTLILPPAKLALGLWAWRFAAPGGAGAGRAVGILDALGKWTMLDVLILAVVIVTLKSSWIADVRTAPGLYFFAASALIALAAGLGLKGTAASGSRLAD